MRSAKILYFTLLAAFFAASCSVTRNVPQGEYLLKKNVIVPDKSIPKSERITASDVERYVRQSPNRKFLGTNFFLWMYNISDTTKDNRWNNFLRRVGEAPVLLDTTLVKRSALNIDNYLTSRGYFTGDTRYEIDTASKKAKVNYYITQREPYRIGEITYVFRDEFLRPVVMADSAATLLRTGDIFDYSLLNAERSRITAYLKDRGYYHFNVNNIRYVADTVTTLTRVVDVRMEINQYLSGYNEQGIAVYENNPVYRIDEIYINPDYDPAAAATDPDYYLRMDTAEYRGLNIIFHEKPRVRKKILRQTINLYPNYIYNSSEVNQVYADLMRLGYYKNASILFEDITDTTRQNLVTFIGDEESDDIPAQTTSERYMKAHINAIPALKQSYTIELEGSTSSSFYALGATLGYQNRNLFRGAELFNVSVRGVYEFVRTKGRKSAYEIGVTTSMTFPRFITPFNIDRYNRAVAPKTKFELSISSQNRPNYDRTITGMNWGYNWSNRGRGNFTLRPVDVNLVKVRHIDKTFYESLVNPYLKNSYESQLIAGISGSYIYNTQQNNPNPNKNSILVRVNWETTGNLFNGITRAFSNPVFDSVTHKNYYKIFGIRYAQYARADISFSQRIVLGPVTSFVYRFYGGVAIPYSNSASVPIDRQFYSGGGNSMRGWVARTLGPGSSPATDTRYPSQSGNMKLEANAEARFPIWGMFRGAVFVDIGNVWYLKESQAADPRGVFKFNRFYEQLAMNTGLGVRLDFNVAVIRVDWGLKLFDPEAGKGWIESFRVKDTVLSLGVGYPF